MNPVGSHTEGPSPASGRSGPILRADRPNLEYEWDQGDSGDSDCHQEGIAVDGDQSANRISDSRDPHGPDGPAQYVEGSELSCGHSADTSGRADQRAEERHEPPNHDGVDAEAAEVFTRPLQTTPAE